VLKQPVLEWQSNIDGNAYIFKIEHEKALTYSLTINGEEITVKGGFISFMFGLDEPFELGGKDYRLVIARHGLDVVHNNKFLIAEKSYRERPAWAWIFVVLNISLLFTSLILGAGFVGGILGFISSRLCISASQARAATLNRVMVCVFITILTYALTYVLAVMLTTSLLG